MDFQKFYQSAQDELVNAVVGMFAKGESNYATHLRHVLTQIPEERLMREPVFQTMFPYETDPHSTPQQLVTAGLLDQDFVNSIDAAYIYTDRRPTASIPPTTVSDMEFPNNRQPYIHQIRAWNELLRNDKSVIVSTGTSSGKTECFTVPILQDLLREKKANPNVGIQAIFLYPLNALISSQRQRVDAWLESISSHTNQMVKYAVYTGETDESLGTNAQRQAALPELVDRVSIRTTPPQILFTNPTMMEYMMVRKKDLDPTNGIRQNSDLKWIVIDEAHSFSGSAAAELALEIRRIINFFGKTPNDIHFAVTSATMGSKSDTIDFVAKLIGKAPKDIVYIDGNRVVPDIDPTSLATKLNSINAQYGLSITSQQVDTIRHSFKDDVKTPQDICASFGYNSSSLDDQLKFLNEISAKGSVTTSTGLDTAILPLRAHFFTRSINGMLACINPKCHRYRASHVDIGTLTTLESAVCPDCGGQLLEVVRCNQCGKWALRGEKGNDSYAPPSEHLISHQLWEYLDTDSDDTNSATQNVSSSFIVARPITAAPNSKTKPLPYYLESPGQQLGHAPQAGFVEYTESVNTANGNLTCPYCGETSAKIEPLSFPASLVQRTFAQTLLNQSEIINPPIPSQIHDGQHYISFTDNRQGSANFDRLLNNGVEREWIRARIYRELVNEKNAGRGAISWQHMQNNNWYNEPDLQTLASRLSSPNNANFTQFCKDYLLSLLIDQLAIRPIYGNSLETMGLVQLKYPTIDNLQPADVPYIFQNFYGYTTPAAALEDWKTLLRILIDITIRRNYHVAVPNAVSVNDLLTQRFRSNPIYSKDAHGIADVKTWPQFNPDDPKREGLLLLFAKGITTPLPVSNHAIDDVNDILHAAFLLLIDPTRGVLIDVNQTITHRHTTYNGYKLDITDSNKVQFELVTNVVPCPVSHQLLNYAFHNISPYVKGEWDQQTKDRYTIASAPTPVPSAPCQYDPLYTAGGVFNRSMWENGVRQWFEQTYKTAMLPVYGTSLDMQFSIFMDRPIFLTVEHSAQIDSQKLRESEKRFREGKLNVLSCSTTMEMGVDIGNLSVVTMNNIPPRPANYLQRIGRAGRRGETQALALTVYDDSPIGKKVQKDPRWIMDDKGIMTGRKPQPPVINIQSATVVYRHIHSLVLGSYISSLGGVNITESIGPFVCTNSTHHRAIYEYEINGTALMCDRCTTTQPQGPNINGLLDHIHNLQYNPNAYPSFYAALAILIKGTSLESTSISDLLDETEATIRTIVSDLQALLLNLDNEWSSVAPALQSRIGYRIKSYWSKSLITYLASKNFLPSANMPTNVVELRTTIQHSKKTLSPSRELNIALYEYAPGQEVCIDDFLTKVQGIISQGLLTGSSAIKEYSICDSCGSVTINHLARKTLCPCGGRYKSLINTPFSTTSGIIPIGFYGGDAYRSNKRTEKNVHLEPLLMDMQPWSTTSSCYQIRSSMHNQSKVLYVNRGNGFGFAFCEYCGRMEPESGLAPTAPIPAPFGHQPGYLCDMAQNHNPNYQPQRNVILTAEYMTDISELQIDMGSIGSADAQTLLYSLGTIVSRKYAAFLGINADEISFGITQTNTLFFFDTHSGGANYSNQLPIYIEQILDACYQDTDDHINNTSCRKACTECLIDNSSKKYAMYLNVSILHEWLQYEKSQRSTVPNQLSGQFGANITKVTSSIANTILAHLRGQAPNEIHYFLMPDIEPDEIFDEVDAEMRKCKLAGKHVSLVVDSSNVTPKGYIRTLLQRLSMDYQLESVSSGLPLNPNELRPIILIDDTLYYQYEVDWNYYCVHEFSTLVQSNITRASYSLPIAPANEVCFINRLATRTFPIDEYLSQILDSKKTDLKIFMDSISNKSVNAEYQDIYLSSPAAPILLCNVVKQFLNTYGCTLDRLTIDTSNIFQRPGSSINNDFEYAADRDDYVTQDCYPNILGLSGNTGILNTIGYLPHFRQLHIYNSEFDFYIIPDGGIANGWLLSDNGNLFPPVYSTPCTNQFVMNMKNGVNELIYTIYWRKKVIVGSSNTPTGGTATLPSMPSYRRKIHLPAPAPKVSGTVIALTQLMEDILKKIDDIVSSNGYEHFYPNSLPQILISNEEPPLLKQNPQLKQWPHWLEDENRRQQIEGRVNEFIEDTDLLLGAYFPNEEKVVLYEKGIQWAIEVFYRGVLNAKEQLTSIVLAHEVGHWITHKLHPQGGTDEWDTNVYNAGYSADQSLLEGWAQLIAVWGIDGDIALQNIFDILLQHQRKPYHVFKNKVSLTKPYVMSTLEVLRSIRPFAKLSDWK